MAEFVRQSRGRPRAGTPADRAGVLRDGGTGSLLAAGIPRLLGKATRDAGWRRVHAAPAEAETSNVPRVRSTVSHPDPRGLADSELAGTSDQAAERSQRSSENSGECPRPREGRRVTVGRLRSPRDRPEDLYHHVDGGRKERKHGRGADPVHQFSASGHDLPQKALCLADLSYAAGHGGHDHGDLSVYVRGAEVCRPVQQPGRQTARDYGVHVGRWR